MADQLKLTTFGCLEIRRGGKPITGFHSNKVKGLLCYLAVTGQHHLRPSLAGLLWGELPEASAKNSLRKALTNLRQLVGPFVTITRQSVEFNRNSPHWLDVNTFKEAIDNSVKGNITELQGAIELFRGDFLEGFYIQQAPAFEEWVTIQRVHLRELALSALHNLTVHFSQLGEEGRSIAIDYVTRLLALEPFREDAHRQLMLLQALKGQRTAALTQYQTCRQILAEELGVEPAGETQRLYRLIRDEELEPSPTTPRFLIQDTPVKEPSVFVCRQPELTLLGRSLSAAKNGTGRVVCVTGGPGRGKTALLNEFIRRSMGLQPDLLFAVGKCSAYTGVGDPYQPFREIMAMLTGDVEDLWSAGVVSSEHARRLWEAVPTISSAITSRGYQVIDTLVDGEALLSRATSATAPLSPPWLGKLRELVGKDHVLASDSEQNQLFEQVSNVLGKMSEQYPLVLILDDLQWIDNASTGLLFHLSRRLQGRRILILCAYRPEEVISQHEEAKVGNSEPQTLARVLGELNGRFGDCWIDLAESDKVEGRSFIEAYIDTELNHLDQDFREKLFQRTAGQPLFSIETLKAMQINGDLVADKDGYWIEGPQLDWEQLPKRVEAVIEQRINSLSKDLRDILTIGSVEGEEFTAQVIARVQDIPEREVLERLAQLSERGFRLIQASRENLLGGFRLSRYRFAHALYRDYLYHDLSPGERRLLHHEVGTALEGLYQNRTEEIAVQLAAHFSEDQEKERYYTRVAGERAVTRYANQEAIHYLRRALELTPETDLCERCAILMSLEKVYEVIGDRVIQAQILEQLEQVVDILADPRQQAQIAARKAWFFFTQEDNQTAIKICQEANKYLETKPDPEIQAELFRQWGLALSQQGNRTRARKKFFEAIRAAQDSGATLLKAKIMRHLANSYMLTDELEEASSYLDSALEIFQELGDRKDEIRALHSRAIMYFIKFDYQNAKKDWERALQSSCELGAKFYECFMLYHVTTVYETVGAYQHARDNYRTTLEIAVDNKVPGIEVRSLASIGATSYYLGEYDTATRYFEESLSLIRKTGQKYPEPFVLTGLGYVNLVSGEYDKAGAHFKRAIKLHHELKQPHEALEALAGLAQLNLINLDLQQAMVYVEEILSHLESCSLPSNEEPLRIYLIIYRILRANDDSRANDVLNKAHCLLEEWAEKITDDFLRHSLLENVPANREIIKEYKKKGQSVN